MLCFVTVCKILEPLQNSPAAFLGPDPVIADALRMAEARAEQLSKMKDDLTAKNIDLENQVCISYGSLVAFVFYCGLLSRKEVIAMPTNTIRCNF